MGRAEAAAHARGGGRARAALLRPRGGARACSRSAAMSTSATTGSLAVEALLEVKQRIAPYIDLQLVAFPQDGYFRSPNAAQEPGARARQGRRRRRRHPAFRAHDGRTAPRSIEGAVRDRGRARPDGRHALRRDRRSAVAPHRDAGRRDAAARPARPRHRLASHLDAPHGQLLCLEAAAADRGGAACTPSPIR